MFKSTKSFTSYRERKVMSPKITAWLSERASITLILSWTTSKAIWTASETGGEGVGTGGATTPPPAADPKLKLGKPAGLGEKLPLSKLLNLVTKSWAGGFLRDPLSWRNKASPQDTLGITYSVLAILNNFARVHMYSWTEALRSAWYLSLEEVLVLIELSAELDSKAAVSDADLRRSMFVRNLSSLRINILIASQADDKPSSELKPSSVPTFWATFDKAPSIPSKMCAVWTV